MNDKLVFHASAMATLPRLLLLLFLFTAVPNENFADAATKRPSRVASAACGMGRLLTSGLRFGQEQCRVVLAASAPHGLNRQVQRKSFHNEAKKAEKDFSLNDFPGNSIEQTN